MLFVHRFDEETGAAAYTILDVCNDVDGGGGNTFDMVQVVLLLFSGSGVTEILGR